MSSRTSPHRIKVVTINLFLGGDRGYPVPVPFVPFLPFLPFPLFPLSFAPPPLEVVPQMGLEGALLASRPSENDIGSHQTRSMGSVQIHQKCVCFGVFGVRGMCLLDANVVLFLLNEI